MSHEDRTQPNKPGGNFDEEVSPDDYPEDADGKPDIPPPPD
ncbi:hypothetical protein [Sphingomonas sp. MS122]